MSTQNRLKARFGLDNSNLTIVNVADPVNNQDASTKAFSSNATNLSSGTVAAARLPAFTGDATSTVGTSALTLATVNSNIGTFNNVTVNAKGLVTAASNVAYLTSYTETDTLASVTGRGATTATAISITNSTASTSTSTGALVVTGGVGVGGAVYATSFNGSGSGLTSLNATNLSSGTISSTILANSTLYVGTTAIALNRASANLGLTGISSVALPGATSGTITLTPAAIAGTTAITIPATAGTLVTTGDTGTVTNTMLAGSIAITKLVSSSVTVGTTAISLGASSTTLAGLTSITSTSFVGALTGNASTATTLQTARTINGVSFDGSANITIADSTKLPLAGGTMTGTLTLASDPTVALQAATKQYVDNAIAGLSWKPSVKVATTANITLSGTQTIDGVAVVTGDRVLVKNQTTTSANGIYIVSGTGWSRALDMDSTTPINEINAAAVFVEQGTTQADTGWTQINNVATLGTDAIAFAQFNGGTTYSQGTGITIAGNVISLTSGVATAGTYKSVTVDTYGRVTAGTNPTTLAGYGITDASPLAGSASITTLGTVTSGTWNAGIISPTYGGTGINNGTRTLTINTNSGTLAFTNAATTLTVANTASVSGTNTGDQTITLTGDVTGTGTGSFATTLANSGVTAGTYKSVTVNAKGLVTGGTNPTTLAGYGITDAQSALGFTPIQQGGGTSQTTNKLYIGWSAGSQLRLQVDTTDFGASWPINVTGNSATATAVAWSGITSKPTTVSGFGITDAMLIGGSVSNTDLNTITTSGAYRFDVPTANGPGVSYGQMLVVHGASDTITQIAGDFATGSLYTRSGNPSNVGGAGSWQAWRKVLDALNYNSYSPTLTGTGASGTWGISITGNAATATTTTTATYLNTGASSSTQDNITTRLNSGYWQTTAATIANGWPTTTNSYYHLHSTTHSNGTNYYAMQFAGDFYNSNEIYYRVTNNNGSASWNKLWHAGNDGAGSGLDADLLDGKQIGTSGNTIPLLDGTNTWSGIPTFTKGIKAGNFVEPSYQINLDWGADAANTWRKIVGITMANTTYSTYGFVVEVIDPQANHATSGSVNTIVKETYYVACVYSNDVTLGTPDMCYVSGPSNRVRAIKTAAGVYEIQIQNLGQYRENKINIYGYASNATHTITYFDGATGGTAIGTYTASTGGSVDAFQEVDVKSTAAATSLTTGALTVTGGVGVTGAVYTSSLGIINSGTTNLINGSGTTNFIVNYLGELALGNFGIQTGTTAFLSSNKSSVNSYGISLYDLVNNGTTTYISYSAGPGIVNAVGNTIDTIKGFSSSGGTFTNPGSHGAVTNTFHFQAAQDYTVSTNATTNAYGFYSNLTPGAYATNVYNFYAPSTAPNYLGGDLTVAGNYKTTLTTDNVATVATSSTTVTNLISLPIATYRSVTATIQKTAGASYEMTTVNVIHDGTNVWINEYGTIMTGSSLGTVTASISAGNLIIQVTSASATSTVYKATYTAITV